MSQFPQITSNLSTANFRASVLTQLLQGIPVTIAGSTGATDYELVVSTYTCKTAFTGASVGDIITQTQVIGITAGVASTLTTIWRNQTTAVDLVSAPSSANLALNGTTALTQAQLQAMTVAATQSGTWSVGVNNFPSSTEISNDVGNPVPINGNVNADVSGTTGTLAGTSNYTITTTNYSTLAFQAVPSGTISAGTVTIYGSIDGVTFTVPTTYVALTTGGSSTTFAATNAITAGQINCTGLKAIRFVSSAFTGGGSLGFTTNLSYNTATVMLDNSIPVGSNLIGKIQPIDGSGTLITIKAASTASTASDTSTVVAISPNSPIPSGSNAIGSVSVSNFPTSTEISNDVGNPVPVSGTITANAGTNLNTSALALESGGNLASIATKLTNGTMVASVSIPATFVTGQVIIAGTGTPRQLPANVLTQGVLITAQASNTNSITIGNSNAVSNSVIGSGNGAILAAGSTKSIAVNNTNLVWINGTAGDIVSFIGS